LLRNGGAHVKKHLGPGMRPESSRGVHLGTAKKGVIGLVGRMGKKVLLTIVSKLPRGPAKKLGK